MEIKAKHINRAGQTVDLIYREGDPLENIEGKILQGVHAFCFCKDKMVLVYDRGRRRWAPPGGAIEPGETYEQAVVREVKEETNMKVLSQKIIGYQDIYEPTRIVRQTRSVCIVECCGEFACDPAGDISEIKLIDPKDHKKYFDWKEIGDRIMERALELKDQIK